MIDMTVRDGHWVSEEPAAKPEGTRMKCAEANGWLTDESPTSAAESNGWLTDETWPTTEEGINKLVASMEAMEPCERSAEETARWDRIRAEDKKWELEHEQEEHDKLVKMWR